MASTRMVADTGIFIDFLRKTDKTNSILFQLPPDTELLISVVTLYELQMGATDDIKKKDIILLTSPLITLPFTKQIAEKAAEIYHDLRKKNQLIEFRDIFIGATALVEGLPLLTKNKKHFKRISGLALVNY